MKGLEFFGIGIKKDKTSKSLQLNTPPGGGLQNVGATFNALIHNQPLQLNKPAGGTQNVVAVYKEVAKSPVIPMVAAAGIGSVIARPSTPLVNAQREIQQPKTIQGQGWLSQTFRPTQEVGQQRWESFKQQQRPVIGFGERAADVMTLGLVPPIHKLAMGTVQKPLQPAYITTGNVGSGKGFTPGAIILETGQGNQRRGFSVADPGRFLEKQTDAYQNYNPLNSNYTGQLNNAQQGRFNSKEYGTWVAGTPLRLNPEQNTGEWLIR